MQWLSLISGVIAILRWLINQAEINKAISADRVEGLKIGIKEMDDAIAEAKKTRQDVRTDLARDPDAVMRDDEFRRKD